MGLDVPSHHMAEPLGELVEGRYHVYWWGDVRIKCVRRATRYLLHYIWHGGIHIINADWSIATLLSVLTWSSLLDILEENEHLERWSVEEPSSTSSEEQQGEGDH